MPPAVETAEITAPPHEASPTAPSLAPVSPNSSPDAAPQDREALVALFRSVGEGCDSWCVEADDELRAHLHAILEEARPAVWDLIDRGEGDTLGAALLGLQRRMSAAVDEAGARSTARARTETSLHPVDGAANDTRDRAQCAKPMSEELATTVAAVLKVFPAAQLVAVKPRASSVPPADESPIVVAAAPPPTNSAAPRPPVEPDCTDEPAHQPAQLSLLGQVTNRGSHK